MREIKRRLAAGSCMAPPHIVVPANSVMEVCMVNRRRFTAIVRSKIVSGGTEGGSSLFEIKYFDRVACLAQSPQFYKEHGVAGLERVYETAHVYRAAPHASSRHLTEY